MPQVGGGDPFVGIVIDPQTSVERRVLQFGAYRNYPPYYKNPNANEVCLRLPIACLKQLFMYLCLEPCRRCPNENSQLDIRMCARSVQTAKR